MENGSVRLGLKYPNERVALSWDFTAELAGHKATDVSVQASVEPRSVVKDFQPEKLLARDPWIEYGVLLTDEERHDVMFQIVEGGQHGTDYRFAAIVVRDDGLRFTKLSILPVREA